MTPAKVIARLRRLAADWRREEARLCEQFGDMVVPQSMRARQIKDAQAIDAAIEMIERLEAAESSVAWHQRRWLALQMHQKKMREPERTIVCDILANGELMPPDRCWKQVRRQRPAGGIKMIDINELRKLTQAVSGWSNCNHAWLDPSEDVAAAVVGHIDESGETYPVATIDCDQYYAAHQSLPLAKFYAAANPATLSELLDRLDAAEKSDAESLSMYRKARDERDALRAALQHEADCVEAEKAKIDALRAEIEELHDILSANALAIRARAQEA